MTLEQTLVGAIVEGVRGVPSTGLVEIVVTGSGPCRRLGIGLGPAATGIGWLDRRPALSDATRPPALVRMASAMIGRRIAAAALSMSPAPLLAITFEGPDDLSLIAQLGSPGTLRFLHAKDLLAEIVGKRGGTIAAAAGAVAGNGPCEEDLCRWGSALVAASDAASVELICKRFQKRVEARRQALKRRLAKIEVELHRADNADALERRGQLLVSHLHQIPRGANEITLEDWETAAPIRIEIAPGSTPHAEALKLFAQARRYRRGKPVAQMRADKTQAAIEQLSQVREEVVALTQLMPPAPPSVVFKRIATFAERVRPYGVGVGENLSASAVADRLLRPTDQRLPFARYTGVGGHAIFVGRGASDNDAMLRHHSRPSDMWFHARGAHGAHVVVPTRGAKNPPPELMLDAATLAAHHSDRRGEGVVEITHTECRYVQKRKKAPPGQVQLLRERVINLRLEPDRLRRLLDTKE